MYMFIYIITEGIRWGKWAPQKSGEGGGKRERQYRFQEGMFEA